MDKKNEAGAAVRAAVPRIGAPPRKPERNVRADRSTLFDPVVSWPVSHGIAGALLASSVVHLLLLIPTLITLQIYDRVLTSRSSETLLMLLAAAALSLAAWWMTDTSRVRWHAACAAGLEARLTRALIPLMLHVPASQAGAMAEQLWRDVASLRGFVGGPALLAAIDLPWSLIYLLVIAAFHPLLGAVALAGTLMLIGLAWLTEWRLRGAVDLAGQARTQAQRRTSEIADFAEVLQAHGQQGQVGAALGTIKDRASSAQLAADLPGHSLKGWGKLLRQVLQLAMLATGAWLVLHDRATGGVMIAGSILLGKGLMPLEVLIGSWKQQLEARKAWARLRHGLASQGRAASLLPETVLPPSRGELRIAHLGVRPSCDVASILHNLDFELPSGALLAVLGDSGSGKSTLARVLAGVQAASQGEVALDGAALHQYSPQARGQATGYLPQDVQLHSGSVAHNIARLWQPTKPLTPEQSEAVIKAAKRAGAHELITSLLKGYDTLLGHDPGAQALSGGQRQRIALARAIYATPGSGEPSLVILDEPNSHLDADGEAALERCLHGLHRQGTTVVVITHRPHLIGLASHVLMLGQGTVEQFGPREQVRQWMIKRNQAMLAKQGDRT
ncbi:Type I secretion system ATP-binding protein PrsD [Variovorax sp. PBL-H6]|uniref:type I secretion system permease/ATPase n=1 Tax=Variovorax sp. PBL-H6 TaxID=434009 RepID=UPI00131940E8|nr:ATP-binding cassette domain-containing protein [Variovorax sp. PBL-H6]VTU35091.1 Type I secretion system ATP-binding protein PrsD [Variovorax sp. PBL-H6]